MKRITGPYVGFGWVLNYDPTTKRVLVYSRLLKGPAGRAGIEKGTVLLKEDGMPLSFDTPEAYYTHFLDDRAPALGAQTTYELECRGQVRTVTLIAERVKRIRIQEAVMPSDPALVRQGMALDRDTGDFIATGSLSSEAIARIHEPRR